MKILFNLVLDKDEKLLWYGQRCWKSLKFLYISGLILLVLGILLALNVKDLILLIFSCLILMEAYLLKISNEYVITNKRILVKKGIFFRKISETTLDKITDISITQGPIALMLNYGNVKINTAGSIHYEIIFEGIENPKEVLALIRSASEKYKRRLNLRTGNIGEIQEIDHRKHL